MPHQAPPFRPEPAQALKARLSDALVVCIPREGDDEESMKPRHFFDFEDGYRLHITRDRLASGEFVIVTGGLYFAPPHPITLVVARVAVHFVGLTDGRFGDGEVASTDTNTVLMAFKYSGPESQSVPV